MSMNIWKHPVCPNHMQIVYRYIFLTHLYQLDLGSGSHHGFIIVRGKCIRFYKREWIWPHIHIQLIRRCLIVMVNFQSFHIHYSFKTEIILKAFLPRLSGTLWSGIQIIEFVQASKNFINTLKNKTKLQQFSLSHFQDYVIIVLFYIFIYQLLHKT